MSKFPEALGVFAIAALVAAPAVAGPFGLGRAAEPDEIAAWDLDVSPDGTGLPEGSGSVSEGEQVFSDNCAACHGDFAEGLGNWPKLAGGDGTLANQDPVKTVGSYWPYLSTVWDYVHRSMPFGNAQSLSADEVYAITAYILYSNFLVEEDFVLSRDNFTDVEMPNVDGFFVDDRPEAEYAMWRTEPCMSDCKPGVEITMKASILDVTPGEAETETEAAPASGASGAVDDALVAAGEKVFARCKACHQVGGGAVNGIGPHLNGIVGRGVAAVEGFGYSGALADHGGVWDAAHLAQFLADPKGVVPGTKMAFGGLKQPDIEAVIEFLKATATRG